MGKIIQSEFNIGTTSFIKKLGWADNIEYLKDKVDHIMLLFLENEGSCALPNIQELQRIKEITNQYSIPLSVHLPHYIHLGSLSETQRVKSIDTVKSMIDFVQFNKLDIEYFVLHPDIYTKSTQPVKQQSQENMYRSMKEIVTYLPTSRKIALETLYFDFDLLKEIITELNLSVIVDTGQNIRYGFDYIKYIKNYFPYIVDIHLHGFDGISDHHSLKCFDKLDLKKLFTLLRQLKYDKNLLIEVHSEEKLKESLTVLKDIGIILPNDSGSLKLL